MVMHNEALDTLVVLHGRVKANLYQSGPVLAQVVLVVRVEEKQEILNVANFFLELETLFCLTELKCDLLKFANARF